jgi:hypothetical protein
VALPSDPSTRVPAVRFDAPAIVDRRCGRRRRIRQRSVSGRFAYCVSPTGTAAVEIDRPSPSEHQAATSPDRDVELSGATMKSILDPTFRYHSSVDTDVRRTFARIRKELARKQQTVEGAKRIAMRIVVPLREREVGA